MISALSSDAIPNCPTYTSPTPSGGTQSVSFLGTVPLAGVGDQSFAGLSQLQSGGRTVYAAELAIRRGSLLSVVNIFSPTRSTSRLRRLWRDSTLNTSPR